MCREYGLFCAITGYLPNKSLCGPVLERVKTKTFFVEIYEQPVRLYMALTMLHPFTAKRIVIIFIGEFFVICKFFYIYIKNTFFIKVKIPETLNTTGFTIKKIKK